MTPDRFEDAEGSPVLPDDDYWGWESTVGGRKSPLPYLRIPRGLPMASEIAFAVGPAWRFRSDRPCEGCGVQFLSAAHYGRHRCDPLVDAGLVFVTLCRKCGKATEFPIQTQPQTAADLEDIRRRVAEACPDHGETSIEEAHRRVDAGEYVLPPPVEAELREFVASRGRVAS